MNNTNQHTLEQNKEAFQNILEDKGVLVYGVRGQFSMALLYNMLRKMDIYDLPENIQITVIVRGSIEENLQGINEQAIKIESRTGKAEKDTLKYFTSQNAIDETTSTRKDLNNLLVFSKRLNIISSDDTEAVQKARNENQIHVLSIPSNVISQTIKDTEQSNQNKDTTYIDCAKGKHSIPTQYKEKVVPVSGANFWDKIINNEPSAIDVVGGNPDRVNSVMDLFHSDILHPEKRENIEAVIKGGELKNLAALIIGFLAQDMDEKQKAKISAEFFATMIECGQEYGIKLEDWFSNSGISDMFASLTAGRNYNAGKVIENIFDDNRVIENIKEFRNAVKEELSKKTNSQVSTIESMNTLAKYIKLKEYKNNPLIIEFKKIISDEVQNKDDLFALKNKMIDNLMNKKRNQEHIHEAVLARISELVKFLKFIVQKSGYTENTTGMVLQYGVSEIFKNVKKQLNTEIPIDDIVIVLEEALKIAFSKEVKDPNFEEVAGMASFLRLLNGKSDEDDYSVLRVVEEFANKFGVQENEISSEDTKAVIAKIMQRPIVT